MVLMGATGMFNSPVVEVAIGLVLIYLVLGFICTSINEYIAQILGLRAENLVETIYGLFSGPDRYRIAEDIYDHPTIRSLSRKQFGLDVLNAKWFTEIDKLPSSIPPPVFSTVLVDLLTQDAEKPEEQRYDPSTLVALRPILDNARRSLLAANPAATPTMADLLQQAKAGIEEWYGFALQRSSGWYKRRAQVMSFMVAAALVLVINADTITISERLSSSPIERAKLDALANSVKVNPGSPNSTQTGDEGPSLAVSDSLKSTSMEFLGWASQNSADPRRFPSNSAGWLIKLLGLAITAFAASLGAPFWFDVLSKFMTVRSGGDPLPKQADGSAQKAGATS